MRTTVQDVLKVLDLLVRSGGQYALVEPQEEGAHVVIELPDSVVNALGLKIGDEIHIELCGGNDDG